MKKLLILFTMLATLITACGDVNQASATFSAPTFDLPNSLGGDVSLKDYEGKNVLLFFHMAVG